MKRAQMARARDMIVCDCESTRGNNSNISPCVISISVRDDSVCNFGPENGTLVASLTPARSSSQTRINP